MISVFVYSVQSCCPPFLHAAALARSSSAAAPEEKTGFGTIVVGLVLVEGGCALKHL